MFLMEEVVCLWMEGGHCRGIEEEALGEKGLSGFMGLRKERWGRKVYRVLEKLYFAFMFFIFYFFIYVFFLKYCANVENCENFKSFSYIYILVANPCDARESFCI